MTQPSQSQDAIGAARSKSSLVKISVGIYLITTLVYAAVAGGRLRQHSNDNHYVYLAHGWLHGKLAFEQKPPLENDWAEVTELTLKQGETLRGTYLKTGGKFSFRTTEGTRRVILPEEIAKRKQIYYISFPWFPAVLTLPFVAIWGLSFNDVLFFVLLAGLNPVLIFLTLRRLVALGYSERSLRDDLWLVGLFAFGTVYFFSAVIGEVWYAAHVVGVALTCFYVLASLQGKHPFWAGLCLGCGFVSRTPLLFTFPLIALTLLERHRKATDLDGNAPSNAVRFGFAWLRDYLKNTEWRGLCKSYLLVALPIVCIVAIAMLFNAARFDDPFEFGHTYLNVRWTERIQRWGLFNYHFISRNLSVMTTLLPKILAEPPYVKISYHGLSLFVTTPMLVYLFWPKRKLALQPMLYATIALPMLLHLMYQNSGWIQFGYRFSLDYMVCLIALLALGGRPIGRVAQALILFGVIVNTFGAITFDRDWSFYFDSIFPTE